MSYSLNTVSIQNKVYFFFVFDHPMLTDCSFLIIINAHKTYL